MKNILRVILSIILLSGLANACTNVNSRDDKGNTPLHKNAMHEDCLKLACAPDQPEAIECRLKSLKKVNELIDAGADVNAKNYDGETPLLVTGDVDLAKILIDAGADVNAKNNDGKTPLMVAADYKDTEFAKILIDAGADVNAKNNEGKTPLMLGIHKNHYAISEKVQNYLEAEFAKILIDAGADVNVKNNEGETALWLAVEKKNADLAKILIGAGADVNTKNNDGKTALGLTVEKKDADLAKILVDAGADINAKNNEGKTPYDIANEMNMTELAMILQPKVEKTRVKIKNPEVAGTLDKRIIQKVVLQHTGELRACYELELAKVKGLNGRIAVVWIINMKGEVSEASVKESTMGNYKVEECIVNSIKSWRFPAPKGGGMASVEYPFVFETDLVPEMHYAPQNEFAPERELDDGKE